MQKPHTVVLLSGGIDSASTLAVCRMESAPVYGLFMDYGQPAAKSEWEAAQKVADHYRIKVKRITLGTKLVPKEGEFLGRNALMILAAAGTLEYRPLVIAMGIHALTEYYDTTPLFLDHMQRILNGYSLGTVTLSAPFLTETKAEVIQFASENGVPLRLTYSCEWQNAPACGQCSSCKDRSELRTN